MFQIKSFVDIVLAEMNAARGATSKVTDFQVGSVFRTLLEAPAVEIEELYHQMFIGLREAIPVATFRSFKFNQLPATLARGYVSVSAEFPRTADLLIPAGTIFSTASGAQYTSTVDVTWRAGENFVLVLVEAAVPGITGNVAANAITRSTFFGAAPVTISNQAITTGRDLESPAEREARFADFIASLSRGTVVAVVAGAKQGAVLDGNGIQSEYVTRSGVTETPGRMRVYLYSSRGTPSAELLADAQKIVDGYRTEDGVIVPGYRAGGVEVIVLGMAERAVPLSITVTMQTGFVLTQAIIQRMRDIFSSAIVGIMPGQTVYLNSMIEMLLTVPGVRAIIPVTTENFICGEDEALIPGSFTAVQGNQ